MQSVPEHMLVPPENVLDPGPLAVARFSIAILSTDFVDPPERLVALTPSAGRTRCRHRLAVRRNHARDVARAGFAGLGVTGRLS